MGAQAKRPDAASGPQHFTLSQPILCGPCHWRTHRGRKFAPRQGRKARTGIPSYSHISRSNVYVWETYLRPTFL